MPAQDTLLDNLLILLQEGTTEPRCAAMLVLGALKRQDGRIVEVAD